MSLKFRVRVFVPETLLKTQKLRQLFINKMRRKTSLEVKALFLKTVFGWSEHPHFDKIFVNTLGYVSCEVSTTDDVYNLVNAGAKPHLIEPRNQGGLLRFQPGYRASTTPRVIGSRRNYRSGKYVSRRFVYHPGFEAREFDKTILEYYAPTFQDDMNQVVEEATQL